MGWASADRGGGLKWKMVLPLRGIGFAQKHHAAADARPFAAASYQNRLSSAWPRSLPGPALRFGAVRGPGKADDAGGAVLSGIALGPVEWAMSGLSIAVAGVLTAVLCPLAVDLLP